LAIRCSGSCNAQRAHGVLVRRHIAPPGAPDRGIPDNIFRSAKCIAVVPDLIKGGFYPEFLHAGCRISEGSMGVFGSASEREENRAKPLN